MSKRSVQRLIKKIATVAEVRPYTDDFQRVAPDTLTPHSLRHSVAYRIISEQ
ncbi:MAG: hypothetical protein J07HX5_01588, partial [halophilic archaeon J07HX5]